MEMVAKDGAKEPKKAKKKAKKKAGKGDGKGEAVLCGCGAVCDQCDQCSQRSKSPVRGTPSLPIQASKSPQASLEMSDPDDGDSRQTQQQHGNKEPPLQSPSRSILGADLVSTPRQSSLAEVYTMSWLLQCADSVIYSSFTGNSLGAVSLSWP